MVSTQDAHLSEATLDRLTRSLRRMGLVSADERPDFVPLTGGVSSLIALVRLGGREFCVKSALAKLKVAADWQVPVERNRAEVDWMREVARIAPAAVPEILGADPEANIFAMAYLDPNTCPNWKERLLGGEIDPDFAGQVGQVLGHIHASTANDAGLAERFANDANFHALRLEPYLLATAARHDDLAPALRSLSQRTAQTRLALVHGDVSPKNILIGQKGPILLDAECAWYGDPAFDLAFCLNHLVLKSAWRPGWAARFGAAYGRLASAYLERVTWEDKATFEARAASLLPGLTLARVDGKSPVEYLDRAGQDVVRAGASAQLRQPPRTLTEFWTKWIGDLS